MTEKIEKLKISEVDCSTGIQSIRDMTDEEFKAHQNRIAELEKNLAAQAEADAAKAAALDSANKKLAKLGLTADEIAAIIG